MIVSVGTFNLNNLFSRWNYRAELEVLADGDQIIAADKREFMGRIVNKKDPADTARIAARIMSMDLDVLAVQEVENIETLRQFAFENLGNSYPYFVLIEGNDPRMIDVGLLSRLPIGNITSHQYAVHESDPAKRVFGRDLLQVQILNASRSKVLFTVFNNHLKSNYVPFGEDPVLGAQSANERRKKQSEVVARIIAAETRPNSRYLIVGDMNDRPDSGTLGPFAASQELELVNALEDPQETRAAKADNPPPPSKAWTHRYKKSGQPADYELYDQIWLSPALAVKQKEAWIDRRTRHGGDGSDHDPAWVVLEA